MKEPVELIIFDCDGVLVDSEPIAMRILLATLAAEGIAVSPDKAFSSFLGRSLSSISASLLDTHGRELGPLALKTMRDDLYAAFRAELRASPGLPDIFDHLDLPICVASSSLPERVRLSLALTGLLPWFEGHIFSAAMVKHGKPEPDLFLHAAKTMAVPPARCLVIEDSPAGIVAARNAGMRVFAYLGGGHVGPGKIRGIVEALQPDTIFDDMHALPDLLVSLRNEKKAR